MWGGFELYRPGGSYLKVVQPKSHGSKHTAAREVSEACSPRKLFQHLEIASEAIFGTKIPYLLHSWQTGF